MNMSVSRSPYSSSVAYIQDIGRAGWGIWGERSEAQVHTRTCMGQHGSRDRDFTCVGGSKSTSGELANRPKTAPQPLAYDENETRPNQQHHHLGFPSSIFARFDLNMKRTAGLLFTLPALGVLSPRSKAEDASAPAYTSCKEECFDSPKCCPQILEGVDPDDCVECVLSRLRPLPYALHPAPFPPCPFISASRCGGSRFSRRWNSGPRPRRLRRLRRHVLQRRRGHVWAQRGVLLPTRGYPRR